MIDTTVLIAFVSTSFLLCLAPGPDNLFVMANSLSFGLRAGLAVTFGICVALIGHTLAVALGLAALFYENPESFLVLQFLGAAYLSYLAWQMFNASPSNLTSTDKPPEAPSQTMLFRRGMIMCLSNPKVLIFFLAFLPQFTSSQSGMAEQLMLLGAVFIFIAAMVFSGFALFTGQLSQRFNQSNRVQLVLNKLSGVIFLALALNLLFGQLG